MLSKITFSLVLLSTVLVLTSFYGNDREEQGGDALRYTLIIENVNPQLKDDLFLELDNIDEAKYYIEIEPSANKKNVEITSGLKKKKLEGEFDGKKQIFEGQFTKHSNVKYLNFSQNKKGWFKKRNTYIIKKIKLEIISNSEKPIIKLKNVVAGKEQTLNRILEIAGGAGVPEDMTNGEFDKFLKNHETNISGTIIQTQQNILQITHNGSDINVEIAEQALSQYTCIDESTDFSVSVVDNSTDDKKGLQKFMEALKSNKSLPGSINQLTFEVSRPIIEEVIEEKKEGNGGEDEEEKEGNGGEDEEIVNTPEKPPIVALGNTYTLDTTSFDEIENMYVIDMLEATGDKCDDSCQIKILGRSGCTAKRMEDDSKSIYFNYNSKSIENGETANIVYAWVPSSGIDTDPAILYVNVPQPPKSISEGINPIIFNDPILVPISDYTKNNNDSILGNRHIEVKQQIGEEDLLIVLALAFPIDAAHIDNLVNEEAQNLSGYTNEILHAKVISKLKTENGQTLSQYASGKNYYDVEDFTLKIFDNKAEATAHRQGKNISSTFDTYHHSLPTTFKNTSGERGHYAFSILKPREIFQRKEGEPMNIYLTFENNNLYTPVKIYAYTIALKPETI